MRFSDWLGGTDRDVILFVFARRRLIYKQDFEKASTADFPRPFIYSRLPEKVKAGKLLTHEPGLITSIGDLKCKQGYKAAFWDREYLSFSLVRAPQWLKINPQTGKISGTAGVNDLGKHEVILRVTNSKGSVTERRFVLEVTDR